MRSYPLQLLIPFQLDITNNSCGVTAYALQPHAQVLMSWSVLGSIVQKLYSWCEAFPLLSVRVCQPKRFLKLSLNVHAFDQNKLLS